MPGPRSTTRRSTRSPTRAGLDADRRAGGRRTRARCRRGWRAPARAARVGARPRGSVSGTSTSTRRASVAEAGERGRHDLLEADRRAARAASAPACSRLMSSRLPTSAVEPVGLLVDRGEELRGRLRRSSRRRRWSRLVTDALIDGERRAQVVRHRLQQRGAQLVGLGERGRPRPPRPASRARSSAAASWAANASSTRWSSAGEAAAARARATCRRRARRRASASLGPVGAARPAAASTRQPSPSRREQRDAPSRPNVARSWLEQRRQRVVARRAACRRARASASASARARAASRAPARAERRRARSTTDGDDEEDDEREHVLGLGDRERVERRREVPVGEQEAGDRGDERRASSAADRGDDDDEQQEQQQHARQADVVARAGEDQRQQRQADDARASHAGELAPAAAAASRRDGAGARQRRVPSVAGSCEMTCTSIGARLRG